MKYIFLHGLGQNASAWDDTIKVLNIKEDVLCPNLADWLDNQKSCYNTLYYALERYCEQVDEPVCLCGLSLGGILAMQYAINHPDKVGSLILIGTQYTMPKKLLKAQNIVFKIMPNTMFSKMGFQKSDFINLCNSMSELDFTHDLKNIRCQVLIVCGEKDKANKRASVQMKAMIPYAESVIISGAGHEINLDNPIKLSIEINRFWQNSVK